MKKKMFAMLTISFMVMAAFGAVAIFDADTDADEFLVINEASGTVSYIPDKINVSVNGTVSFKPTVNWIAGGHGGFYTDISVSVTSENIDNIFTVSCTDNVVSVVGVSTGTDKELTVMVTSETYIGDSATGTPVITKEASYTVYVNVWAALELPGSVSTPAEISEICYFGEAYVLDLSGGVEGSGQYANSVSGLPDGLYMLGTTVLGMAYESNFEVGTGTGNKTLDITVVDLVTGSVKSGKATMNLSKYQVNTELYCGEEDDPRLNEYVDQGTNPVMLRYTVTGHETAPVMNVKIDGISVDTPGIPDGKDYYELDLTDTAKIIGKHVITFNYEANGYTYNAHTYELFVVGGMDFVVPSPNMVVTLGG